MIRINKNLFIFAGLIFLLGTSVLIFLQRFLPLLSHISYYCQSVANSLSLPIPYFLGIIPFFIFSLILTIAVIKLFVIYVRVQLSKRTLLKKSKSRIGFNSLIKRLRLEDKIYLIEAEKQFAFCLGIRAPKIYISTSLVRKLTKKELEAVLLHERYHLRNRDTFTMLIASLGESLLPFFPLFSDFLHNYRIEREIRADAEAIQELGSKEPVISVLRKLLSTPSFPIVAVSAIADQDTLEPRIKAIVKNDFNFRRFSLKHIFVSIVSIIVMSIITLAPVHAMEIHGMGEDVVMICPHDDSCLKMCQQAYSAKKKNYSQDVLFTPVTK